MRRKHSAVAGKDSFGLEAPEHNGTAGTQPKGEQGLSCADAGTFRALSWLFWSCGLAGSGGATAVARHCRQ